VAFEVGRGNLGPRQPRVEMPKLVKQWNDRLAGRGHRLHFRLSYGHTGNFQLESVDALSVSQVSQILRDELSRLFAVFAVEEFSSWLRELETASASPPSPPPDRRATPGAIMNTNPDGDIPVQPSSDERIIFSAFARRRVRGLWKMDRLRADGLALDQAQREGGFGSIAQAMSQSQGGQWTARSLSTLRGLAKKIGALPGTTGPDGPIGTPAVSAPVLAPRDESSWAAHDVMSSLRRRVTGTDLERLIYSFLEAFAGPSRMAVVEAGAAAEGMAQFVCQVNGVPAKSKPFAALVREISQRRLLSGRVVLHMDTIRSHRNIAAHPGADREFSEAEVQAIGLLLLQVVDEIIQRRYVDPGRALQGMP